MLSGIGDTNCSFRLVGAAHSGLKPCPACRWVYSRTRSQDRLASRAGRS